MSEGPRYFDSSALAKLVLRNEEGAEVARSLWQSANLVYCSTLGYPESCAAITGATRNHRIAESELLPALDQFEGYWHDVAVIELAAPIPQLARQILLQYPLSGADAVHVASALFANTQVPTAFITWDQRQASAAAALGLAVTPAPND